MANSNLLNNPGLQKMPKTEREWVQYSNEMAKFVADQVEFALAQAAIVAAQASADSAYDLAEDTLDEALTAQVDAEVAQTSADNAGAYWDGVPSSHLWRSDGAGAFPAGNPTRDLTLNLYDNSSDKNILAIRVLRGTLTSAAGTVAVTNVSSTGLASSYIVTDDGTDAPKATITATFGDGTVRQGYLTWTAIDGDTTATVSTPGGGGGK